MDNKICFICGKDLTYIDNGVECTEPGIQISLSMDSGSEEYKAALKRNLGKYVPADSNIKEVCFSFCLECLIDSLMSKPKAWK